MKRFEQRAEERKERMNILFEEVEAINSFIKAETKKFDMLIKQSEQTRLAILQKTGELELFQDTNEHETEILETLEKEENFEEKLLLYLK